MKITQNDVDIFEELLEISSTGNAEKANTECFNLFSSKDIFHKISMLYVERIKDLSPPEYNQKMSILYSFTVLHLRSITKTLMVLHNRMKNN